MVAAPGYTVLIDGYNVIKQHPDWSGLSLQHARQALIAALQQTRWPVQVCRIELVFDSAPTTAGSITEDVAVRPRCGVHIAFATPTADAAIQRRIRQSDHPRHLIIISNDRAILDTAKSHGALCHTASWLIQRSQPKRPQRPLGFDEEQTSLTEAEMRRINAELAKRWGV